MEKQQGYLSMRECREILAAELGLKFSPPTVRTLCKDHGAAFEKLGSRYFIRKDVFMKFVEGKAKGNAEE